MNNDQKKFILINIGLTIFVSVIVTMITAKLLYPKPFVPPDSSPVALQQKQNQACASDEIKFCANLTDAQARDACLNDHFSEVSELCNLALQKNRDSFSICSEDIQKHCPNALYGGGRMLRCLKAFGDKLSAECAMRVGGKL